MKTLFLKELVENKNWLILVFFTNCLMLLILQYFFESHIHGILLLFFNAYQFKKLVDRQLNSEMQQRTWQFLILRAVIPKQIIYAKLSAGVVLILLAWAVPYIASSLWLFGDKQRFPPLAHPLSIDDMLFVGCMLLVYFSFWLLSLYHFLGFRWLTWAGYIIGFLAVERTLHFSHFVVDLVSATGGQSGISIIFLGVSALTVYLIIYLPIANGKRLMFGIKSQYTGIGVMLLLSLLCFIILNVYSLNSNSSTRHIASEEKRYFVVNKQGDIIKYIVGEGSDGDDKIKATVFDETTIQVMKKREQAELRELQLRRNDTEKRYSTMLKDRPPKNQPLPHIYPKFLFQPDDGFVSNNIAHLRKTGYYRFDLRDLNELYFDPSNIQGLLKRDSSHYRHGIYGAFNRSNIESLLPTFSERSFNQPFIGFSGKYLAFKNSIFYFPKSTQFSGYDSIAFAFTIPAADAVRDIFHDQNTLYVLTEKYLSAYTISQKEKNKRRKAEYHHTLQWQIEVSGKIDDYEAIAIAEIDELGGYLLISQEHDPVFRFIAFNEHKQIVDDFTLINEPRLSKLNQAQSLPPLFWLSPVNAFFNQLEFFRSGEANIRFDSILISRLTLIDWLLFFLSMGIVIGFTHRFCRKQQLPWLVRPPIYLWAAAFGLVWLLALLLLRQGKAKITCPHCYKKAKANSNACQHCSKVFFSLSPQAVVMEQ